MINLEKYSFKEYSEKYKQSFNKEKFKLKKLFPGARIEHVGSTAVPGLGGKGIIDIVIKTSKNKALQFRKRLEKLNYKSNKDHPVNDKRLFFQKIIRYGGKERRIHVHLVLNEEFWKSFILFRDYLRNHNDERDKYAKIKKRAAEHAKGEKEKYRKYKKSFLERVIKLALEEKAKIDR